jgi:hypothetical protein
MPINAIKPNAAACTLAFRTSQEPGVRTSKGLRTQSPAARLVLAVLSRAPRDISNVKWSILRACRRTARSCAPLRYERTYRTVRTRARLPCSSFGKVGPSLPSARQKARPQGSGRSCPAIVTFGVPIQVGVFWRVNPCRAPPSAQENGGPPTVYTREELCAR